MSRACGWMSVSVLLVTLGCVAQVNAPPDDDAAESGEGEGEGAPACFSKTRGVVPCDAVGEGEGEPGGNCAIRDFSGLALPPRILLVVDKSWSMADPAAGFGARKWDAERQALEGVVQGLDAHVQFGLMLFPGGDAHANICQEGGVDVDVATQDAGAITTLLDAKTSRRSRRRGAILPAFRFI